MLHRLFFVFLFVNTPAVAAPCATVLSLHGFKAAAQIACGFTQVDNEAIGAARQCAQGQAPRLNLAQIETGGETFTRLERRMGHEAACDDVFEKSSPLFHRTRSSSPTAPAMSDRIAPSYDRPFQNLLSEGLDLKRATFHGEGETSYEHNEAQVLVFEKAGLVVYKTSQPSIAGSVRPNDLLFSGILGSSTRRAAGTAFVFKSGCKPAFYLVSGHIKFEGWGGRNEIVLRGRAPMQAGGSCDVVVQSAATAYAVLRIESTNGDL